MFKLHKILEDWITENTAGVLGLTGRKWGASLVEIHCNQRGVTGITALLSNLHSMCMFKEVHHHVAFITGHPPFWSRGGIQHQNPTITLHTLSNAQRVERVLAGWMGTFIASHTFLHVPERWVAEAVGAQRVTLAPGPRGPQHQLKVIQWTAELLVQLDGSILGKTVSLVTVGAVESAGFGLDVLHEAVALATTRQGLPTGSNGGKGDFHQLIHAGDGIHKIVKLPLEDIQSMLQDLLEVGLTLCDKVKLLLNSAAYGGQHQLCICFVVAMYQDNAQIGWLQLASILYCHIVPLADVVDVDGDTGISTNAMFLHEGDELGLGQVVRGAGLLFHQLDLVYCVSVSTFTNWHSLFQWDALPRHHLCVAW